MCHWYSQDLGKISAQYLKLNLSYEFHNTCKSNLACNQKDTYTWNVQEHTQGSKLLIKTMLRNVRNALFLHDIAHAIWEGCMFIFDQKHFEIHSIYLQFIVKKLQSTFFLDTW